MPSQRIAPPGATASNIAPKPSKPVALLSPPTSQAPRNASGFRPAADSCKYKLLIVVASLTQLFSTSSHKPASTEVIIAIYDGAPVKINSLRYSFI
jgi:hypothetical protein